MAEPVYRCTLTTQGCTALYEPCSNHSNAFPELSFGYCNVAVLTQLAEGIQLLSGHMQGSELKKTGGSGGSEEEEGEEDDEDYADEEEDEEDGGKEDLPEGKTGSKVMTRRQKAIAEGKS